MDGSYTYRVASRLGSLVSLVAIVALLVGVPLALVVFVGWPLPHEVPAWDQVRDAFERNGVPVEVVINGLAVVVWVAWVQLAWAILAEAAAVVRGRTARQVFAFPGAQLMARRLVASAALVLSSFGSMRVTSAAPLAPLQEIEPAADPALRSSGPGLDPQARANVGVTTPSATSTSVPTSQPPAPPAPPPAPAVEQVYEVKHGDTFWGLAEQYMGSGMRWRELRDRNVGRAVAPGRVLAMGEDHLDAGWRLVIPTAGGQPMTAPPSAAPPGSLLSTLPEESQVIDPPDVGESETPPLDLPPVIIVEEPAAPIEVTAPTERSVPTEAGPVPASADEADETDDTDDEVAAGSVAAPPAASEAPVEPEVVAEPEAAEEEIAAVTEMPAPVEATPAPAPAPAEVVAVGVAAVQQATSLIVEPGDHFWSLAERQLETAWGRAVSAEEVAPYWRNLIDSNQVRLRSGDPDLIFPGEQFLAPAPPPNPEARVAPSPSSPPAPPVVPPAGPPAPPQEPSTTERTTTTETPSTAAPTTAAPTTAAPTTAAPTTEQAPAAPAPTGTVSTRPPTTAAPETTETTAPPETTDTTAAPPDESAAPSAPGGTATVLDSVTEVEPDEDEEAGADASDEDPFPYWLVAGSAAFAGLVLAALRRRRRSRRRLALPGDLIEGRPLEDIRTEKAYAIVAADVPDIVGSVSQALGAVIASNPDLPPVTAVVVSPSRTAAIFFAEPCLPVAPFVAGPPSDRWDLYLDDLGGAAAFGQASSVLDTLTVLGRTDADEWVFIDIESLGAVELAGDPVVAAELAQSMVAELSLQPAGEPLVDLTIIGMDQLSPVVADQGVVTVDRLDQDLVHRFERTAENTGSFLDRQGLRSTAAARAQGVERDGLFVTVVAYGGAEPADPILLERLAIAATPGGRGVAVVAVGPLGPGATRLVVTEDGRAHIPRLGITVTAARLARDDLDRVAEMLAREPERPTPGPPRPTPTGPDVPGPYQEPAWSCCVRIFADHQVETRDGRIISFRYGENPDVPNKNTLRGPELLAYLALSGRAASATDVRDHLWWDRPVALATVNKLLYGTRKVLGGADMLSLAQDDPVGRYRLSPDIVTDAELLHHALEHAHAVAATDPDEAVDLLHAHLSQIEAVCFRSGALGQGLTEWASAYRVIDRVEQPVIDAALLMAKLCTSRGPEAYAEALWAVDQGLKACPVNEALVRAGMELEAWLGSPDAANGRYQNLAHRLASDELEPEPETNELRARLRRSAGGRLGNNR